MDRATPRRISGQCPVLGVSRSGYYEWLERPPSGPAREDPQLREEIERYFEQGRGTYGTRRIKPLLAETGHQVSRPRSRAE
ncbi:MAG: IS3 family transposase [Gammaproteobacteria bacterium]